MTSRLCTGLCQCFGGACLQNTPFSESSPAPLEIQCGGELGEEGPLRRRAAHPSSDRFTMMTVG